MNTDDESRREPAAPAEAPPLLCPSYIPCRPGEGVVFGIVAGTLEQPRLVPLGRPERVTEQTFELAAPHHPSEIFRIAAPCIEGRCKNFDGGLCRLASSTVRAQKVSDDLPFCPIRHQCLWWAQEGKAACLRCPEVVSNNAVTLALRVVK